ncbi:MAG: glycosyltransferase family 2 protein [Paracoccaceae bacterium]
MAKDDEHTPQRDADPRLLGEILLAEGVIVAADIERAIHAQLLSRARIGEILVIRGGADASVIAETAARQSGHDFIDLRVAPLDGGLIGADEIDFCLRNRLAPFRDGLGQIAYVAASPELAAARLSDRGGEFATVAAAEGRAFSTAFIAACGPRLAERSATRRPDEGSLRPGFARWQVGCVLGLTAAAAALTVAKPGLALAVGIWGAVGVMVLNGGLWAAALLARPRRVTLAAPSGETAFRALPIVTLLVPLYREPETAPLLMNALAALDYPAELLDIKIILEADDAETLAALGALGAPRQCEILIAPAGAPRTKPRALNFALDFARGAIIGIYDAEDRPAPDQITQVVAQFAAAPADVACVQARLGYYNARENWLTRCFEIEYASWFDAMLPGLFRLGMPIPLGGTSLFLRREALDAVGGWDSHNVTEDADLGMMLARAGLRTELSPSITEEEASSTPGAWVRQRSRWLKGYLSTWTTHMRRPVLLFRELGPWRFLGFNGILLSAVLGYLSLPWLWLVVLVGFWVDLRAGAASEAFGALSVATTAVLPIMFAAAAFGLWRRGRLALVGWTLTLPAYWGLGALAAYLALWELVVAPSSWRKTQHGVGRIARELRAAALRGAELGRD